MLISNISIDFPQFREVLAKPLHINTMKMILQEFKPGKFY